MRVLLLLVTLSVLGAVPAAGAEKPDWKVGQVLKAELVGVYWAQGYLYADFFMPDGHRITLTMDPVENCMESFGEDWCDQMTPLEGIEHVGPRPEDDVLDDDYLGRRMLIVVKRVDDERYIAASSVRVDPDHKAPRNTWILPHRGLRGKIVCSGPSGDDVYLITKSKKRYRILPKTKVVGQSFLRFCEVTGTVTLEGDFLLWDKEEPLFQTESDVWKFVP